MTNDYVTLPREPTREMLAAFFAAIKPSGVHTPGWLERGYAAMIAAAPPAASGRARELVWQKVSPAYRAVCFDAVEAHVTYRVQFDGERWYAGCWSPAYDGIGSFDTKEQAQEACQARFNAHVCTLLAPAVDEAAAVDGCPRCGAWHCDPGCELTETPSAASSEAAVAWRYVRGKSSYIDQGPPPTQEEYSMFDSITPLYEHPAPTTADAGVTEAMVETFEAKFLECARTRPDSTLRDDIRAALEAALGARKGE